MSHGTQSYDRPSSDPPPKAMQPSRLGTTSLDSLSLFHLDGGVSSDIPLPMEAHHLSVTTTAAAMTPLTYTSRATIECRGVNHNLSSSDAEYDDRQRRYVPW